MTNNGKGGLSIELIKKLISLNPEEIKNTINNKQNTTVETSEVILIEKKQRKTFHFS